MRNSQSTAERTIPSQYMVQQITSRGLPVPPTYGEAQALLDSFPPSDAQQRRLEEIGLAAETRGEAKQVIADYLAANPAVAERWEAENARGRVERRQARRGEQDPSLATPGMYKLLAESGVTPIPTDYAQAAALIDQLPPSENMAKTLREHGKPVPATRAEASEIIRGLPATPNQIVAIMRRTGGRYAPSTRGEAERWFNQNPLPGGRGAGAAEMAAAA